MSSDLETAQQNLAFMRQLVEASERPSGALGLTLLAAGVLYGLQTLIQWMIAMEWFTLSGPYYLGLVVAVTAIFLIFLTITIIKVGKHGPRSIVGKAMEAGFMAAGLVNACLVIIFSTMAYRLESTEIWYLYAPIVCALQGGAWLIAQRLRQKLWLLAVSLGWFATALALTFTIGSTLYILIMTLGLLAFMAAPGAVLMHQAQSAPQ